MVSAKGGWIIALELASMASVKSRNFLIQSANGRESPGRIEMQRKAVNMPRKDRNKMKAKGTSSEEQPTKNHPQKNETLPARRTATVAAKMMDIVSQLDGSKEEMPPQFEADSKTKRLKFKGELGPHLIAQLKMSGSKDIEFAQALTTQISCIVVNSNDPDPADLNSACAALDGVAPRDEIEGMLGAQMVATHNRAMRFLALASLPSQSTDGIRLTGEIAIKLLRTFTAQMEALNRYRGKGQQKVTVEHVTVNQGGQAVIGNVERPKGGGGDNEEG